MPLSESTKDQIKYYRYLHEEKVKWDSAFKELANDRKRRQLEKKYKFTPILPN